MDRPKKSIKKLIVMKTIANYQPGIKIQFIIIFLAILALINNAWGTVADLENYHIPITENSVNDIPFDTHEIAINHFFEIAMTDVKLEAESDISDIPFNTLLIKQGLTTLNTILEPEQNINDIPFNTHDIAQQYRYSLISDDLVLLAETYMNDIPFETSVILARLNQPQKTTAQLNLAKNLPEFVMDRLANLIKASLISALILFSTGIIGFLFFSYVY
jgi:hypothetical protein